MALPALTWDLPSQGLEGLEGTPPVELQLLHECSPGQVSPEKLPGPEDTGCISSQPFPLMFPVSLSHVGIWEGLLLGVLVSEAGVR